MFITEKINVNELFSKGFTVSYLTQEWADNLLRIMGRQSWVEVIPDVMDSSGEIDKYYENRYISVATMLQPNSPSPWFSQYMDDFCQWASPVLSKFEKGYEYHVGAFCGTSGYYMDAHCDVGDRSVLDIIAYFGDGFGEEDDGGCLDFYKVDIRDPENKDKMTLIERVVPKHGMVVVFNNMNPSIFHSVSKLTKPGCKRFQLIAQAGMLDKPDWHVNFEAKRGFYHHDKKAMFGDTNSVLEILKNGSVKQ